MFFPSRARSLPSVLALTLILASTAALTACGGHRDNAATSTAGEATSAPAATSVANTSPTLSTVASPTSSTAPSPTGTAASTTLPALPPGTPASRLSRGTNGKRIVALSFDAGSDVGYAAQILDLLKADGIHASFGVTGRWAENNPDLLRRIVNEGHHLINHTYDHQSLTGRSTGKAALSRTARADELRRADDVFVKIAGTSAKPWFRPPYGDIDTDLDKQLAEEGYRYDALWSLDSLGWKGLSASAIAARCNGGLQPGAILLFHVGSQSQDAAALPAIISAIRSAGLQPGSVRDVV